MGAGHQALPAAIELRRTGPPDSVDLKVRRTGGTFPVVGVTPSTAISVAGIWQSS
jgi:hypothetical protein